MAFRSIHTTQGLLILAQAEATGTQIRLTHMAVGDGNGNPVEPDQGQTSLVRERFRATVNRVYQDPENPAMFTAELIIPATEGGFVLREVGIFDSGGNLIIVGNLPDTYKPEAAEGAFSDTVVRVPFMVTNADTVELKIDPNVVVATQSWIINTINPAMLFPGGTTNQILRKKSNADGDTEWADPSLASVVVDVIEEEQTLVADQTIVTWVTVTNIGLAVYIEGVRIPRKAGPDGWDIHETDLTTKIVLGKAYPAGTKIFGVQNEPLGEVPFPLEASKNLSDVPNKVTARENLGVYSKEETDQKAPTGIVGYFARSAAPVGWLKANGAAVSRTAYAKLFAAIGTMFGAGDGFNTFNLPDLRGEFIRGWDDGRGLDSGRSIGSNQAWMNGSHSHTATSESAGSHSHSATTASAGSHTHNIKANSSDSGSGVMDSGSSGSGFYQTESSGDHNHSVSISNGGAHTHTITVSSSGGTESRPRNIALLACIKF